MRRSVRSRSWNEPWRDTSTFRPMATPSIFTFTYPPPPPLLRAHFTGGHPTSSLFVFLRYTHTHTRRISITYNSATIRRQDLGACAHVVVLTVTTAAHSLGVWFMLADAAASVAVVVVPQEERKRGLVGGPQRLAERPLRPARTGRAAEETGGERLAVPGRQREPELQLHPVTSPYLVSFSGSASSARAALISYAAWSPRS